MTAFRTGMVATSVVALTFLAAPILVLVPMSLSKATWLSFPPRALTLDWYGRVLGDREWREAAVTSVEVAVLAAGLAGVLGVPAGLALARSGGSRAVREAFRGLALAPVMVPVMIVAVALYAAFAAAGIGGTLLALVLAHATLGLPYVVMSAEAAGRTLDPRLDRAARGLGASAWQAFRRITMPLARTGIVAGLLFAAVVSFDEAVVALFVAGPQTTTLPRKMWSTITQDEFDPLLTAVASIQIVLATLLVGAAGWLATRSRGVVRLSAWESDRDRGPRPGGRGTAAGVFARQDAGDRRGPHERGSLSLAGLTKRFGEVVAVEGLTLAVASGELVTLLGPSGCGKTTALNLIAGFERPDAGEVRLDGMDLTRLRPERRNVGMIFQDYALFPHLTVFENVAFPLRLRGVTGRDLARRVADALELVRLPDLGARQPRQLSGGQQQRVALARALVFRPPVLLLDEPFAALDRGLRETMQAELRALQQELGLTVLLVTHDQAEAMTLADRIAVLRHGRLQQMGPPAELYERPANVFVAGFLGASNLLPGRVVAGEGPQALVETDRGTRLAAEPAAARAGERVVALLRPEAITVEPIDPGWTGPPAPGAPLPGAARADAAGLHGAVGVIEEATYLGAALRYRVRLETGERLTVTRSRNEPGPVPDAADAVHLHWSAAEVRLLPVEPDESG